MGIANVFYFVVVFFCLLFYSQISLFNFFFLFLYHFYCFLSSCSCFFPSSPISNLVQYSSLYFLFDYPNNFLAINLSSNSPFLNIPSSLFCLLISFMSLLYSFSNFSIASFALPRFSFLFQVSDFAINPFYYTRYLSFSLIHYLFNIFSTFYFSFPSIMTRASCCFFYLSTCPTYFHTLLILTTRCIFTILDSSNSTTFNDIIFFIL